jgi:hypothetical protein
MVQEGIVQDGLVSVDRELRPLARALEKRPLLLLISRSIPRAKYRQMFLGSPDVSGSLGIQSWGLVEPRGFEPLTSAVRLRRSPN